MKIVTIVGARPQFIKAAPISQMFKEHHLNEVMVHTGQHYSDNLSDIFFRELNIPSSKYNLGVGSGNHGAQTGNMLIKIEEVLLKEQPDWVLVYGDTNSTLAGALASVKLHIKVAHVEAGLRSGNRSMPEEINRIITDHVSSLLLCPNKEAVVNLAKEGVTKSVYVVGDVAHEVLTQNLKKALSTSNILRSLGINKGEYILATVHRAENTDNRENLLNILNAFTKIKSLIIFPIHPRTKQAIERCGLQSLLINSINIKIIEPVGYFDMICLEHNAKTIITDSGGIQKEANWLGVPCVTLRNDTEWNETIKSGGNILVGTSTNLIIKSVNGIKKINSNRNLTVKCQVASAIYNLLVHN